MKKVFKVAHIRDLEKQIVQEQISYSRMVEIMNEMAHEAYTKVEKLPIHGAINWAYFNDEKPNYGDQILRQDPPEQMGAPRVEIYDRDTTWIDGSRYAVITPCL